MINKSIMSYVVELIVFGAVCTIGFWITAVHFSGAPTGYMITGILAGMVDINLGETK